MNQTHTITTVDQYLRLSVAERLRLIYASQLLLVQLVVQTRAATMAILELVASNLPADEKEKLANTEFDPEPLAAIQRMIEDAKQEFNEDLHNDVYNSGI